MDLILTYSNMMPAVRFVDEWLKRSKSLPVYIVLNFRAPPTNSIEHEVFTLLANKILAQVAVQSERCAGFKFIGSTDLLAAFSTRQFSKLHSLQLISQNLLNEPLELPFSPYALASHLPFDSFSNLGIGFSNLTGFVGTGLVASDAIKILEIVPLLTSLVVLFQEETAEARSDDRKLEHRSLKSITLRGTATSVWSVLDHLLLPSVKRLVVSFASEHGHDTLLPLVGLLKLSKPPTQIAGYSLFWSHMQMPHWLHGGIASGASFGGTRGRLTVHVVFVQRDAHSYIR